MNPIDRMMAWAQVVLSALFLTFTFIVIVVYELGLAHLTAEQDKSFNNIVNWLTGAALIILYFWFQRTRTGGIPDSTPVVTQTHTAPDGSRMSITSPAHLPLPPIAAPANTATVPTSPP